MVQTRHGRIGVGVCYDIEFPELTRGLALAGAELIALPTNWPREDSSAAAEPTPHLLARATAYFSHVYVAVCDRGGEERGAGFQGATVIAGPRGTTLAAATPGAGAETVRADCDLSATRDKATGPRNDAIADRRPQHYMANLAHP